MLAREFRTKSFRDCAHMLAYNAYSIWLFTQSDLKTILVPSSVFAGINYSALGAYGIDSFQEGPSSSSCCSSATARAPATMIIGRTALAALWIWMHLLPFSINNQRGRRAVMEDSINKPWRPMPCGRVTATGARALVFILYPAASITSLGVLGGARQSFALLFLGTWYNEWGGADVNPVVRNLVNSLGYICFASGALEVAYGAPLPLTNSPRLVNWLLVLGGIILTTVHLQDMYDQKGDLQRDRRTVPLVIGDVPARYSIAGSMVFWGFFCPRIWHATWTVTSACYCLALVIVVRTLVWCSVPADKRTFQLWNLWICFIYMIPLFSTATVV